MPHFKHNASILGPKSHRNMKRHENTRTRISVILKGENNNFSRNKNRNNNYGIEKIVTTLSKTTFFYLQESYTCASSISAYCLKAVRLRQARGLLKRFFIVFGNPQVPKMRCGRDLLLEKNSSSKGAPNLYSRMVAKESTAS